MRVRLRYDAYDARDANILRLKLTAQLERAALYVLNKWGVRMEADIDDPVFVRRYDSIPPDEGGDDD